MPQLTLARPLQKHQRYRLRRGDRRKAGILLSPMRAPWASWTTAFSWGHIFRSLLWAGACFLALHVVAVWAVHRLLDLHGWLGWAADLARGNRRLAARVWLFLPVASADRRIVHRPHRACRRASPLSWLAARAGGIADFAVCDGLSVAARILLLNLLALIAALMLPGIGLILAWIIGGYAIGRGLFAAVAMRRMSRTATKSLYRRAGPDRSRATAASSRWRVTCPCSTC